MNDLTTVLVSGGFALIVLQYVIKPLIRGGIWAYGKIFKVEVPNGFDFSEVFYTVAVPVLNVVLIPAMAYLGIAEMPTDPHEWVISIVLALLGALVSVGGYNATIGKMKSNIEVRDSTKLELRQESKG